MTIPWRGGRSQGSGTRTRGPLARGGFARGRSPVKAGARRSLLAAPRRRRKPAFFEQINYSRTALHELSHATGHAARLGRDLLHPFGSAGYAREELVAELGSAFLCAALEHSRIARWRRFCRENDWVFHYDNS